LLKEKRLSEVVFVAFDVETTGLDSQANRIVEVGAVRFGRDGPRDTYGQLVNPDCPMPSDAKAIHGITDEMVAGSPRMSSVLPDIIRFFGDSVLVAHNAQFDIGFFNAAFAEAGVEPLLNPVLCTRELARGVFPGLPDYKLATLARTLGIPPSEHHRALADAGASAGVFGRCVGLKDPTWEMSLGELLRYHGPLFWFGKTPAQTLEAIKGALESQKPVRIEYKGANGRFTLRDITPLSVEERGRSVKIVAYCHLRRENRTFRLDRITRIL
jgi:DNA polymerase III epsilon subunit family exonuclease